MFGSLGGPELIVILVIALLIFGPRKLPSLGRTLGKGLAELRRASSDLKSTLDREVRLEEQAESPRNAQPDQGGVEATIARAVGDEDPSPHAQAREDGDAPAPEPDSGRTGDKTGGSPRDQDP